eukprot:SAG25_NODE_1484_length_2931_cov_3.076271_9_plen_81_part_00
MQGEVRTEMRKLELQHLYLEECGILSTFKRWLEPLNGKAFPNFNLKNGVMEVVDEVRSSLPPSVCLLYRPAAARIDHAAE